MQDPSEKIGGRPAAVLRAPAVADRASIVEAQILPGRGMMLLQARGRVPGLGEIDILHAPSLADAARELDGGPEDFAGNKSFAFGGAILLPYANRIRGADVPGAREIRAELPGGAVARLPRNWGGKAPGAAQYAMHGLILATPPDSLDQPSPDRLTGRLDVGDFGGRWPSRALVEISWALAEGGLELTVETRNVGREPLPLGVGWHPYFALPSGERAKARLTVPATARLEVDDYDQVLPTGRKLPVGGTEYDARSGLTLGDLYLDDCFVDLEAQADQVRLEVADPAARYGVRLRADAPPVRAVQVYAPPSEAFVVVEPQYNWPDPFSPIWSGADTGMARVPPGGRSLYRVRLELFTTP